MRKILGTALFALLVAALLFMLGKVWIARLTGDVPALFGYQLYVVETGSMLPTLPIGSTLLVRELAPEETLAVGDIITYAHEKAVITHRITELVIDPGGVVRYQTRGDNPDNASDPWLVSRESIRGVVLRHFAWPAPGR